MRCAIFFLALLSCTYVSGAQESIRKVDFKNFTYPLSGHLLGHGRLEWLGRGAVKRPPIHLVNGSELTKDSSFMMDRKEYTQYEGFTLESVKFGDVIGDGHDEAIVVLHYRTGGTQTTDYVYVYTLQDHKPKLLAYCHTGSRADSGLDKVYAKDGVLVFELLDPERASGACCSSGVVISRYKWQNGRFERFGPIQRRKLASEPITNSRNH
jgi:hypothetical protein